MEIPKIYPYLCEQTRGNSMALFQCQYCERFDNCPFVNDDCKERFLKNKKWLVIQSNLAQCPEEPMLKMVDVDDYDELMEILDDEERNCMNITAVPVKDVLIALGYIQPSKK